MPKKKSVNAKNREQRKLAADMSKNAKSMRESASGMNKKKTTRREDVNQAAARIVRQATE